MKRLFTFYLLLSFTSASAQSPAQVQYDAWENADWVSASRMTFALNGDGTVATAFREGFVDPDWMNRNLFDYTYNATGKQLTSLMQEWNIAGMHWDNLYQSQNTYDASDRLETTTGQLWELGQWNNHQHNVYAYDAVTGNMTGYLQQYGDVNGNFADELKVDYTYDGDGNRSLSELFIWENDPGFWGQSSRTTYTYTSFDEVSTETQEVHSDNEWINFSRITTTYNADEQLETQLFEMWDYDAEVWMNASLDSYTYNADGTMHQFFAQEFDAGTSEWLNYMRATFIYPEELGAEELSDLDMTVFPNPAGDQLSIAFDQATTTTLSVTDLSGKEWLSETASGALHSLDIKELPAGVYLLHVVTSAGRAVRKIVKA